MGDLRRAVSLVLARPASIVILLFGVDLPASFGHIPSTRDAPVKHVRHFWMTSPPRSKVTEWRTALVAGVGRPPLLRVFCCVCCVQTVLCDDVPIGNYRIDFELRLTSQILLQSQQIMPLYEIDGATSQILLQSRQIMPLYETDVAKLLPNRSCQYIPWSENHFPGKFFWGRP